MQVQFINFTQWVAGFAASIIAGSSVLLPNFAALDDNAAQDAQPQKKKRVIVRRVQDVNTVENDSDAPVVHSYRFETNDSTDNMRIMVDDSLIVIDHAKIDSLVKMSTQLSDSLVRVFMFKNDSLMKGTFKGKRFLKNNLKFMCDTNHMNMKFSFRNLDSTMKFMELNFRGMDSAFKNMDFNFKGLDSSMKFFNFSGDSAFKNKMTWRQHGKDGPRGFLFKTEPGNFKNRIMIFKDGENFDSDSVLKELDNLEINTLINDDKNGEVQTEIRIIKRKRNGSKTEKPEETILNTAPDAQTLLPWNFQLSPNPSNGVVNISCELPSKETPATVGIYDLLGNEVFSKENISPSEFRMMQIDLAGKPSGTYILQIAQGGRSYAMKFEIQQ